MSALAAGFLWAYLVGVFGIWLAAIRILREKDSDEGVMAWVYAMIFIAGLTWVIWIWVPIGLVARDRLRR